MKNILRFSAFALASLLMVACNDDYKDWANPISYPEEAPINLPTITATATSQVISLDDVESTVQLITLSEATLPAGMKLTKLYITPEIGGVERDDLSVNAVDLQGNFAKDDLQNMLEEAFGKASIERDITSNVYVDGTIGTQSALFKAGQVVLKLIPVKTEYEAIVPDPVLYLTGSYYNWGETWLPLTPTHSHSTISWTIIYLHKDDEFKFAPQAGWGDDFGYETVNDYAGMNPSQAGTNIKVGNAGWYLIKVDNTVGARVIEFYKPNVYLIGETAAAGWNVEDSGLFTIPTSENDPFVSPAFAKDAEVRMCVKFDGIDW